MIQLRLLGAIELVDADGRELRSVLAQPKRFALLAVLAAQPRAFLRRDTLLALFWPELDDTHGRWALGQALRFLRTELGDPDAEVLISRGAADLGVNPAALRCDAAAFHDHLANGELAEAIELYRGDLLPAFFLDAVPAFEEWLERERARLRRLAADAARRLAEDCERASQLPRAVDFARRAVELSDDDERAVRELIAMLDRIGDRAGALAAYERFTRRMSSELGAEPSAETQALVARVRARSQSTSATVPESPSAPLPAVDALAAPSAPVHTPSPVVAESRPRRWTAAVVGAAAVLLLALGLVWARARRPPTLTPDLLVVAPFEVPEPNLAPWREGLSDLLARDLDGAGTLRTVSPSVALKSFSGRADASTSAALARRVGARLAMFGMLQHSGRDSVRASLAVIDAGSGRTVAEVDLRDAVDRIDRLADSISASVMRRLSSGNSRSTHGIGTRSLTALKEYLQGSYWWRRYGMQSASARDSASAHFERAVELDTGFALAWSALADVETWPPPNLALARKFGFRAAALNHGLGPRDSMTLLADSLVYATGAFRPLAGLQDPALWSHLTRLYAVTGRLAREYPRDSYLQYYYADVRFHMPLITADVTDADVLAAFDRAIAVDSTDLASWRHAVPLSYFTVGREDGHRRLAAFATVIPDSGDLEGLQLNLRLESAGALSNEALRAIWDSAGVAAQRASGPEWLGAVAFARDSGGVELRLRESVGGPSPLWAPNGFWASRLTYRGRLREAARLPQSRNTPAFAVLVKAGLVSADSISAALRPWKPLPMPGQPCGWLMDWLAARADTAAITNCVSQLRRSVSDTTFGWRGPMIRALNAFGAFYTYLARRDTAGAVRALDVGVDTLCPVLLCSAWQMDRAAALAAVGRRQEALRIVRARLGQNEQRPIYPMMQLQRARLAMRLGDTVTALSAYSLVADAWTGADPELQPFVAEARRALVGNRVPRVGAP